MFVYQKTMFDRYLCMESFGHLKLWKINASKISFLYYYNGAQKHGGFVGFEKACSRAKLLTSLNYLISMNGTVDDFIYLFVLFDLILYVPSTVFQL